MDTLAHAVYGATLFSRAGLSGGLRRRKDSSNGRALIDWTFWAACAFGILPDIASIGVYFAGSALAGEGISFHGIPGYVFALYNITHSLIVASIALGVMRLVSRDLFVTAFAWPLHIAMDIFTHSRGRFQTPFLYPISDISFDGISWWMHPWFVRVYWGLLPAIWICIAIARRSRCNRY